MNKFLTFPGLQPVYLGDIDFLQESVRSAFLMLLRGLTGQVNPRCIIAYPTQTTDGVICFDGEILPLKWYGATNALCFRVESEFVGERTFKSGESHKCYEQRYVIGYSGTVDSPNASKNFPTLPTLLSLGEKKNPVYTDKYERDDIFTKVEILNVDNSFFVSGYFEILEDQSYLLIIWDQLDTLLPIGTWIIPVVLGDKIVIGTLSVQLNSITNKNQATLQIASRSVEEGTEGSFSLNIISR